MGNCLFRASKGVTSKGSAMQVLDETHGNLDNAMESGPLIGIKKNSKH